MSSPSTTAPEPLFFYVGPEWYKGREPRFYDVSTLPWVKLLEESYPALRDEIEAVFAADAESFPANFTPYAYSEAGWRTVNLYSYFLRYPAACARFPTVDRVVRQIPGMCLAQIAVLEPHTRIKAHRGDCSALIRTHLGIRVPAGLPELGIRVGREERGWEEGRCFAIQIAHRHYAWNRTDQRRLVLVVDVIRPEYFDARYAIAGKALAAIAMKWCATKLPVLKKLPRPATRAVHAVLGAAFRVRLWVQRRLGL